MRYRLVTNERQGAPKGTGSFGAPWAWDQSGTKRTRPLWSLLKWDQTNPSPLVPTRP